MTWDFGPKDELIEDDMRVKMIVTLELIVFIQHQETQEDSGNSIVENVIPKKYCRENYYVGGRKFVKRSTYVGHDYKFKYETYNRVCFN